MGLKVVPSSLHWSHPSLHQSPPSSSHTLASAIPSPSSRRCSFISGDVSLFCRFATKRSRVRIIRKVLPATFDSFSDEEFSKEIEKLGLRFQMSENYDDGGKFFENSSPPDFPDRDEIIPANIERKANSVDIPLSLRVIRRKKQWQKGIVGAGELASCSMKKAFSSMMFIIRELHSYTLRSILFYDDLQGILANVQKEIHSSFVWLFQTVFSQTPTLMVYVMILLANYSVYSISSSAALAAAQPYAAAIEEVVLVEDENSSLHKFDSSIVRIMDTSSTSGANKAASVRGNNGGGGGKFPSVASGMEGDGRFDDSNYYSTIGPNGVSSLLNPSRAGGEESVSNQASMEQEAALWHLITEEASRMQSGLRDGALDQETMKGFVSPIDAKIEADDHQMHFIRELFYKRGLAQEPNNPLLLANYAQFLYLVVKDLDRAEEYFKRATKLEPKDAETLSKYANFLWLGRNDLWAAEETFLEAIDAEPTNPFYAANYAHFLWNTGGEDTCFPLTSPDVEADAL